MKISKGLPELLPAPSWPSHSNLPKLFTQTRLPRSWIWVPGSGYDICAAPGTARCLCGVLYLFPCHSRGLVLTTSRWGTKQRSGSSLYIFNHGMKTITNFQAFLCAGIDLELQPSFFSTQLNVSQVSLVLRKCLSQNTLLYKDRSRFSFFPSLIFLLFSGIHLSKKLQ